MNDDGEIEADHDDSYIHIHVYTCMHTHRRYPNIHTYIHACIQEVHLNDDGEIEADHDDPNGRLMPHNKFQDARYPDGVRHGR